MKVAIYVRVSTQEQNPKMQERALIEKAEREGWYYEIFVEKESTRKTRPIKYQLYQRLPAFAKEGIRCRNGMEA